MATRGAKAATLLLGRAVKVSRIGTEQTPCVQVRCRENIFNDYLKMYFARSQDFWAIDERSQAPPPSTQSASSEAQRLSEIQLGDTLLIRPVEHAKRTVSTVTHEIVRTIERYGVVYDPITKERIIEQQPYSNFKLRRQAEEEQSIAREEEVSGVKTFSIIN